MSIFVKKAFPPKFQNFQNILESLSENNPVVVE
ncbi:hypothetical protein T4D_11657 [Trichinella pseudospiralis]|uniref:Uncharacterized protein n=1 Tax=Trichinella pseudospiralis TaxID=6337 RepID=A0A0V1EQL5_TRIPS|nr:hypothetical protein T4D_11657 [Trichinella pseudospiralis]